MPKQKTLREMADERAAKGEDKSGTAGTAAATAEEDEEVITGEPVFDIPPGTSAAAQAGQAEQQEDDRSDWVYITVAQDANGQPFLPGHEPKVIAEFYAKLKERQVIADEQAARAKKLQELNEDISSLGRKYRSEFRQSETKPTVMEYHCAGFVVEVEKTETEKTTVHKESTKQQTSAQAAGGGGKKPAAPGKDDF